MFELLEVPENPLEFYCFFQNEVSFFSDIYKYSRKNVIKLSVRLTIYVSLTYEKSNMKTQKL